MAVTKSSSAGNNLSDAIDIVNASLATKATYTYAASAPSSPTTGQIWMDTSGSVPIGKVWNGSAWANFSLATADFSNSATGTYTSGGINYKYITYTGSSSITINRQGLADVFVLGGGGSGGLSDSAVAGGGGGGGVIAQQVYFNTGTYSIQIGAGAPGRTGKAAGITGTPSFIDRLCAGAGGGGGGWGTRGDVNTYGGGGGNAGSGGFGICFSGQAFNGGNGTDPWSNPGGGGGAGGAGGIPSGGAGFTTSITGSNTTFGAGGDGGNAQVDGGANTGKGGSGKAGNAGTSGAGGSGIVIVRVRA